MIESDPADLARKDIEALIEGLPSEDRKKLRAMAESELFRLHWDYGMELRNQFRHGKFLHLLRFAHTQLPPEGRSLNAMSTVAIREIWRHLQGRDE